MKSSVNFDWPWAQSSSDEEAESVFAESFPSVHAHLKQLEERLRKRQDQGRFWWELRTCSYWSRFDEPKIMYPEITWRTEWGIDYSQTLCNNTAYIIPDPDPWIVAVMNSPLIWAFSWRRAQHGKDEALRFIRDYVRSVPIAIPSEQSRETCSTIVSQLTELAKGAVETVENLLDWLRVEFEVNKPNTALASPLIMDSDEFVSQVRKIRGKKNPLSAAGLKALRDEYERTIQPAKELAREALTLEHRLSDLVNEAYGLAADEIDLIWQTAPPRMPIQRIGD